MRMPSIINDLTESGRAFAEQSDYENAIVFFKLAVQELESEMQSAYSLPEKTTEWHIRFYDINLQLGSTLILQKEYEQAEKLFIPVMEALQKLIGNMAISMLQRAPLVSLYKGYFYALVCLYGESGEDEKMKDYVAVNTAQLSQWFINMPALDKGNQLN